MHLELQQFSHRRLNQLTGEWILVSPHRAIRPWQGQEEEINIPNMSSYDEDCYLCAGNVRANGSKNPMYDDVFVFENDFSAIQDAAHDFQFKDGLLEAEYERGICKVVCFSPDHSKSLALMSVKNIQKVVRTWQEEFRLIKKRDFINYVQIFENKGAIMGCSNPHPHGQIWSHHSIPNEVLKKDNQQKVYFKNHNKSLLSNYLKQELSLEERIVFENRAFVVLVPYWAIWPFETMIIPKHHQKSISEMTLQETLFFAEAISVTTKIYNVLFNCEFPYSSGIHQAPCNNEDNGYWHWHMSFYPPLLRNAAIKKFMVGYEMFATPQRDFTPETAAEILKSLAEKLHRS